MEDGWMEAAHSPWQGGCGSFTVWEEGMLAAPWGARRVPCPLAANQSKRSPRDRPWYIPRESREEQHKLRGDVTN